MHRLLLLLPALATTIAEPDWAQRAAAVKDAIHASFGAYMAIAPFVEDSDDQLQQISQAQIFLTLVASIGLRMTPPDPTPGSIVSVCLFAIPIVALLLETPLVEELRGLVPMLKKLKNAMARCVPRFGRSKRVLPVAKVATTTTAPTVTEDPVTEMPRGAWTGS